MWSNFIRLSSVCHPCRGFLVISGPFPHPLRGGLRCDVPAGLLQHRIRPLAEIGARRLELCSALAGRVKLTYLVGKQ